jgi:hypothetical protein
MREVEPQRLNERGIPVRNPTPPAGFNPYVSAFHTITSEKTPNYLRGSNYTEINSFSLKAACMLKFQPQRHADPSTVTPSTQLYTARILQDAKADGSTDVPSGTLKFFGISGPAPSFCILENSCCIAALL